jgi:hypothetical protein
MSFEELRPDETELVGAWVSSASGVQADENCRRIDWLTSNRLVSVGSTDSGWATLFRDPRDGRLWERIFPHSEMHGGGPPSLTLITPDVARKKYRLDGL